MNDQADSVVLANVDGSMMLFLLYRQFATHSVKIIYNISFSVFLSPWWFVYCEHLINISRPKNCCS